MQIVKIKFKINEIESSDNGILLLILLDVISL